MSVVEATKRRIGDIAIDKWNYIKLGLGASGNVNASKQG